MELTQMTEELFQAAQSGDTERLTALLEVNPHLANIENSDGLTLLGYAAHFGNKAAVQLLLDSGADVNSISHSKVSYIPSNTALHAAIAGERDLEVIQLLLSRNAKTTIFDSNSHTCLHSAAFHDDNVELIRLLLAHGADVNACARGGDTALSLAIKQGNHAVEKLLRQSGAHD